MIPKNKNLRDSCVKNIRLDASNWNKRDDFYDALFLALGSPDWHGRNFNALRDSIITGHINRVERPFTIYISGVDRSPSEVQQVVRNFRDLIKEFHAEGYDVDIVCE